MVTCERCQDVHTCFLEREALKSRWDNESRSIAPGTVTSDEDRIQQDSMWPLDRQGARSKIFRAAIVSSSLRKHANFNSTTQNNNRLSPSSVLRSVPERHSMILSYPYYQ